MLKKIFWFVVLAFAGWWIYIQVKKEKIKKQIQQNPALNENIQTEAANNKISYSDQLNKTAYFIANNS